VDYTTGSRYTSAVITTPRGFRTPNSFGQNGKRATPGVAKERCLVIVGSG
jgi:hypothetical protein